MPKRKSAVAASTPSSTKKQKREIVTAAKVTATDDTTPRASSSNRPRRVASTHTAPKQSKYFERSEEEESGDEASESGYEDENGVESQQSDNNTEEDDYDSDEEERKPAKRSRKLNLKKDAVAEVLEGKNDLWREGVKTGLGPGHQVFIAKPKARGDGGIPYMPEKIHPHTMEFLKDLKKNNDRVWFKAHDADYRASWKDFGSFVETLTEKIAEVDETIPELPPKDLVFRIYRDVRFSSDPTPYKPRFSAAWSRTGRKGPYACYYIQVQPGGKCFVGSGLWQPEARPMALLRTDIDQQSARIKSVLTSPGMRKHIFGGISKDTKKAIQAFCDQNKANALKTKPKVSH